MRPATPPPTTTLTGRSLTGAASHAARHHDSVTSGTARPGEPVRAASTTTRRAPRRTPLALAALVGLLLALTGCAGSSDESSSDASAASAGAPEAAREFADSDTAAETAVDTQEQPASAPDLLADRAVISTGVVSLRSDDATGSAPTCSRSSTCTAARSPTRRRPRTPRAGCGCRGWCSGSRRRTSTETVDELEKVAELESSNKRGERDHPGHRQPGPDPGPGAQPAPDRGPARPGPDHPRHRQHRGGAHATPGRARLAEGAAGLPGGPDLAVDDHRLPRAEAGAPKPEKKEERRRGRLPRRARGRLAGADGLRDRARDRRRGAAAVAGRASRSSGCRPGSLWRRLAPGRRPRPPVPTP